MSHFDLASIADALPWLLLGLRTTLQLTLIGAALGLVLGAALALARLSSSRLLARLAAAYVTAVRALPLLMVLFWVYFLLPLLLQRVSGSAYPPRISALGSAYLTFTLFEAAYFSEILRAGMLAVPRGQLDAAQALGLRRAVALRRVVLPQALRQMLPLLLTQSIVLFQDVSLVALLAVTDFVGAAVKIAQRDGRVIEMYSAVALGYLGLSLTLSTAAARLQRRLGLP